MVCSIFKIPSPKGEKIDCKYHSAPGAHLSKIFSAVTFTSSGQSLARSVRERLLPRCANNAVRAFDESVEVSRVFVDHTAACTALYCFFHFLEISSVKGQ